MLRTSSTTDGESRGHRPPAGCRPLSRHSPVSAMASTIRLGRSKPHLHADFVSGHLSELARRTGAEPSAWARALALPIEHRVLHDGDELAAWRSRPPHAPHHTRTHRGKRLHPGPRLVHRQGANRSPSLPAGDTLFIGDVGRPDLSPTHTPQQLAAILYDSLPTQNALAFTRRHHRLSRARRQLTLPAARCPRTPAPPSDRERRTNYALLARCPEQLRRSCLPVICHRGRPTSTTRWPSTAPARPPSKTSRPSRRSRRTKSPPSRRRVPLSSTRVPPPTSPPRTFPAPSTSRSPGSLPRGQRACSAVHQASSSGRRGRHAAITNPASASPVSAWKTSPVRSAAPSLPG